MIPSILIISMAVVLAPDSQQMAEPMTPSMARSQLVQAMDNPEYASQLELYAEIIERCPDVNLVANAHYERGVALVKQSEEEQSHLDEAIEDFRNADALGTSSQLQRRARYNIGHAFFQKYQNLVQDAESQQPSDIQGKIDQLKAERVELVASADAFRSVWEVDSGFTDSAKNLQRVRKLIHDVDDQIKQLEDMAEQMKQQQEQKQKDQQRAADKLKDLADQQQKESQESSEQSASPEEQRKKQQQQKEDQDQLCNQTDEAQSEMNQDQIGDEDIDSKIQEAKEAQEKAKKKLEEGDLDGAAKDQAEAAEKLREASKAMQEKADQTAKSNEQQENEKGQQGSKSERDAEQPSQDGQPKDEGKDEENGQADQITEAAKDLLDKERREREARQVYRAKVRPVPVERDW